MSNKIRFIANKDTNYIFHMLSVARCGYDNAYGEQYRHHYANEDLSVLKEQEELLTVCGGEHCGALYHLLISQPACAKISAKAYYADLVEKAISHTLSEQYQKYADTICRICAVMLKYYDHYIDKLWANQEKKINQYIPQVLRLFQESQFAEKAEALVGCTPPKGTFTAALVTSVENGAEGIDISDEIDVFGMERTPTDALYFIGHEYIIYLLFRALKEEHAFKSFETWNLTEALAEFYLKQILGDTGFFTMQEKYVAFYESSPKNLSAAELYRLAQTTIT